MPTVWCCASIPMWWTSSRCAMPCESAPKRGTSCCTKAKSRQWKSGARIASPKPTCLPTFRFAVNTVEQRIDSVDCFAPMRYAVLVNSRSGATQTEGGIYLWPQGIVIIVIVRFWLVSYCAVSYSAGISLVAGTATRPIKEAVPQYRFRPL